MLVYLELIIYNIFFSKTKDYTVFRGHGASVDQLCWNPRNPDQLATASGDKTVRIWDARTNKAAATVNTKGENINICWSPDGSTIAVGNKDDLVTFIDVKTHRSKAEEQFKFEVNEISKDRLQKSLDATSDARIQIADIRKLEWPVRTLSFSNDGKMLASASEDLVIDIAEVETGEKLHQITCDSPTFTVAWHPKRHLLAYACDDRRDRDAGIVRVFGFPSDT
uniref:Anaphase-promoting complex subunit 4-like WD40 domain-containing protein n=1 Tax=Biomphalaria glabrata TaxID=6526 RepID=A0A2C9K355_BIOGL